MSFKRFIFLLIIIIVILQGFERKNGLTHMGASPYNSDWDGTSKLVKVYSELYRDTVVIDNWFLLYLGNRDKNACNILLIVSPERGYNSLEKWIIYRLVYNRGYNIIILDEGSYSNDLLLYLNIPIQIRGHSYVKDLSGSSIIRGKILLDNNGSLTLFFAYVSPVTIYNESVCKPIAFINDVIVGARCNINGRRFLVVGDGSIVTNSVMVYESIWNPYIILSKNIISSICNSSERISIYMDATKYRVRLATIEEMIAQGYSYVDIISILFKPSRYIFILSTYIDDYVGEGFALYLLPPVFVLFIILTNRLSFKNKTKTVSQIKVLESTIIYRNGDERVVSEIVNAICDALKETKTIEKYEALCKCKYRRFKIRKNICIKEFKQIIDSDKEFRRYVLSILSNI